MDDLYVKLLHFLPDGASILDPSGRVLFINDAYLHSINEKPRVLLDADLYSPEHNKKLSTSVFMSVMEEKREIRKSQLYVNDDGFVFNVMLVEKPIMNGESVEAVLAFTESVLPMGRTEDLSCLSNVDDASTFIFESPAMRCMIERINRIARLPTNILLVGETGVGKDKMAEYIHSISDRKNAPLVTVNCAAIAENLIESELFGYENGAFTGAAKSGRKGLVEQANGGTLFLDEINSLPLSMQGKLLRALETKLIRRVGGSTEHKVDFRLISASNEDLEKCVEARTFREDLFYRINVFTERIPPLRERREDIMPLLNCFISGFAKRYHIHFRLMEDDIAPITSYHWPGNVRELRNFAEQIVVVGSSSLLQAKAAAQKRAEALPPPSSEGTLKQRIACYERAIIREALKSNPSKAGAAKELGIDPAVLSRKIAKYGLRD